MEITEDVKQAINQQLQDLYTIGGSIILLTINDNDPNITRKTVLANFSEAVTMTNTFLSKDVDIRDELTSMQTNRLLYKAIDVLIDIAEKLEPKK